MTKICVVLLMLSVVCAGAQAVEEKEDTVVLDQKSKLFLGGIESGEQTLKVTKTVLPESSANAGKPGLFFSSQAHLQITAMAMVVPIDLNMESFTKEDYSLDSFDFSMESAGTQIFLSGTVKERTLTLNMVSAGAPSKQEIDLKGPVFTPDAVYPIMARKGLKVGLKESLPVYDPMSMSSDTIHAEVVKEDELSFGGMPVKTYLLKMDLKGFEQMAWIDKDGICYQEESDVAGQKFIALRVLDDGTTVDRPLSMESPAESVDLLQASFIRSNVKFEDSYKVRHLKAALHNMSAEKMLWDPPLQRKFEPTQEQKTEHPDSIFVEVNSVDYEKTRPKGPVDYDKTVDWAQQHKEELDSSILIQSDNPKIVAKAEELTEGAESPWEEVDKISKWVYHGLQQVYRVTIPSAVEILESMSGDCNEHSTLFAALCRARGIPTKICSGIVYLEGSFGYHAWNEVLLPLENGESVWIPIDTTFGQKTVDATHIKLAEGGLDQQTTLAGIIGKLKIDVLDYSNEE